MNKSSFSRRNFLKMAGLVSAGLSTSKSSLFNLTNIASATNVIGQADEYKALVCLYFGGGADTFNMIVPRDTDQYNIYADSRSNLALRQDELLPINALNSTAGFGLHPQLGSMQSMFGSGELCFINNIGTLVRPTSKVEFENASVPLPLGLFSHSDQTNQWQTAVPNDRLIKGWAGRMSDMLYNVNTNQNISLNVSLGGINTFQSSEHNVEFAIDNNGAAGLDGYGNMYNAGPSRTKAIDRMFSRNYGDPFMDTYKSMFRKSLDSSIEFQTAIDGIPEFNTTFSTNNLSGNFQIIAKIIAAQKKLGFTRQIFFIDYGGWDTHDELLQTENGLFNEVNQAIGEFSNVLKEIDMFENIVTFSMSEFGRTLTSNGNGTDHAWGGNMFAFGGPVRGNQFYGQYPELRLDSNLDVGGGVLIPTTPTDLYFAELAIWFGVPVSELGTLFPNLTNFYSPSSTIAPLGFLDI